MWAATLQYNESRGMLAASQNKYLSKYFLGGAAGNTYFDLQQCQCEKTEV